MEYQAEVGLALILVALLILFKKLQKPHKFPPGPPALPLIGSIPFIPKDVLTGKKGNVPDYLADKYGDVVGFYNGHVRVVFISDIDILRKAFKTDHIADRPVMRPFNELRHGSGFGSPQGYLFSFGRVWKEQRRFALKNLKDLGFGRMSMEGLINTELNKLVNLLKRKHEGIPTSLNMVMNVSVVNALWVILVGEELSLDNPKLQTIVQAVEDMIRANSSKNLLLSSLGPFFVRHLDPHFKRISYIIEKTYSMVEGYIRNHKKNFDESQCNDFIDLFLNEIKNTTDKTSSFFKDTGEKALKVALLDLFLAGTETTTSTLMWGILFLLHNPDIQTKVHQEIDNALAANQQVTMEDENKLPYTCSVIKEILRKSSIVSKGIPHRSNADIEINGYIIPKDTLVFGNLMRIHHDPRYWKDPMEFNPDRFYDKEKNQCIGNNNMGPFGIGKRVCLGQTLAERELFLFFVGLMKAFNFEPSPEHKLPACDYNAGPKGNLIRIPPLYKVVLKSRCK